MMCDCDTCFHLGPDGCSLTVEGESHQGVMVTSVGEAREVAVTGRGECGLTLLVVGGGGAGYYGGGGSGYMEYRTLQVKAASKLYIGFNNHGEGPYFCFLL